MRHTPKRPQFSSRFASGRVLAGLTVMLGGVVIAGAALAQEREPGKVRVDLERSQSDLDVKQKRAEEITVDVAKIRKDRKRINARLLDTAARIQESEERMSSIEARLGELGEQERLVRGSLDQRHDQISKLLGSLQRMGRNPPPVLITRREDALAMVRSAMLLASAFPGLRTQALALSSRLDQLVRVMTNIRQEAVNLRAESKRLTDARTRLSGLMSEKKKTLVERQQELEAVQAVAAEISKNVKSLNELIVLLDRTVTENTRLAEHEAKLAAAAQLEAAQGVPDSGPSSPEAVTGPTFVPPVDPGDASTPVPSAREREPRVAVLAPPSSSLQRASPGRIEPAIPFRKAKGSLPVPARGKRVLAFGEKTTYGGASKGLVLQTRFSAQITSPCDGWIVYAGEFRSYGQLLIINAGGGYHVLLAGLSQIDAQPGQFVLASEPVGTMGESVSSKKRATPQDGPVLYIEFRKDGRPINPDPWWVAGHQKVQG